VSNDFIQKLYLLNCLVLIWRSRMLCWYFY